MEWINKLVPFITLVLGWGLAQFGKYSADKKEDKKKLKKLLFNLLELRNLIKKEVEFDASFERLMEAFGKIDLQGLHPGLELGDFKSQLYEKIAETIKDNALDSDRIEYIENHIDNTVVELAEIYPVFAHELSGKYKIRERIKKVDDYINKTPEIFEGVPFNVKEWVTPKLAIKLLSDLDENIKHIAKRIGRDTSNAIRNKLSEAEFEVNNDELEKFLEEYLTKITEGLQTKLYS